MKAVIALITLATVCALADFPTIRIEAIPHVTITVPPEHIPYTVEICTNLTEGIWDVIGDPTNYFRRTIFPATLDNSETVFYRITCWDGTMYMAPDTNVVESAGGFPAIPGM